MTEAELNELLEEYKIFMDGYYYPHMLCALRTGLRLGKRLRINQKKWVLKNGRPVPEWVFANKKGKIFGRVPFENALHRCLESRKIRIHDLRHTYATVRLLRGHNVGDVSYQFGHSSIQMTYDIYGHWVPGHFKSEVDELDEEHPNALHTHPKKTVKKKFTMISVVFHVYCQNRRWT